MSAILERSRRCVFELTRLFFRHLKRVTVERDASASAFGAGGVDSEEKRRTRRKAASEQARTSGRNIHEQTMNRILKEEATDGCGSRRLIRHNLDLDWLIRIARNPV